jgi:hypothetical protein
MQLVPIVVIHRSRKGNETGKRRTSGCSGGKGLAREALEKGWKLDVYY